MSRDRLEQIHQQIAEQKQPPVHKWTPDYCGEIDIRIDDQANWFHEGEPIIRHELVKLFSSILWFEDGQYFLVTPVEKLAIQVADVPFVVQQLEWLDDDAIWLATTNTDERIIIGEQNPVELRPYGEALLPYIKVRYDLWARPTRSIYYQWVSDALDQIDETDTNIVLTSAGYHFSIGELE